MAPNKASSIAAGLRARIRSGELRPGTKLPTMEELMAEHGVSRPTAHQVLAELKREGLATYRPGRGQGTIVRKPPTDRMVRSRRVERDDMGYYSGQGVQHWRPFPGIKTIVDKRPAPVDVAKLLGVEPDTFVDVRERFVGDPDRPEYRQTADSWLHPDIVGALPVILGNTGLGGMYDRIEEWANAPLSWAEEVTAKIPSPEEAESLLLPSGVALLRILRTSTIKKDGKEIVVEVQEIRMSADLFSVRYPILRHGDAKWPVRPAGQDFYSG